MTEDEWRHALDCAVDRLAIAVALFRKLELDAVGDLDEANHWEMVQEFLVGKRDDVFAELRESVYGDDPECQLAEHRVREWLRRKVRDRR